MPKTKKQQAYTRGKSAEWLACQLLRAKGYRILAQRFKSPVGEIDIVAFRKKTLVMVEVKSWQENVNEAITLRQRQRIERASMLFIAKHPQFANLSIRFDAMLWQGPLRVKHLKSAWEARA